MEDFRMLLRLFREKPVVAVATLAGTVVGAAFGVLAYYNGWLG